MAQFARPDADVYVAQQTFSGENWLWWASTSADALYTKIDEAVASDSDYAWFKSTGWDTGIQTYRAGLSDIDEPSDLTSVSIRVRVNNDTNCRVQLYDGSTQIKSTDSSSRVFKYSMQS